MNDLILFTLKIGQRNIFFSTDFIGLRRNFSEIISVLEKIGPNIFNRLLIFDSFVTY